MVQEGKKGMMATGKLLGVSELKFLKKISQCNTWTLFKRFLILGHFAVSAVFEVGSDL